MLGERAHLEGGVRTASVVAVAPCKLASVDGAQLERSVLTVAAREIPHKGGRTLGYRLSDGRATVAYVTDHCPTSLGPGPDGLGAYHEAAVELARGADLLIHDAQLTATEVPAEAAWGHAAAEYATALAVRAGARRVVRCAQSAIRVCSRSRPAS